MKNIILDIGGIITNVSDEILIDHLHLSLQDLKEFLKKVYSRDEWKDCLRGKITQKEYLEKLIKEDKQNKTMYEKLLLEEYQKFVLPVYMNTVNEIKKIKAKYKIYALSNLTEATYNYLKDLNVLDVFDDGVYSFECGFLKPQKEIYELLIDKYNLKKEECIFFDDSSRNVLAANELGIKAIKYNDINDIKNNVDY